MNATEIVKALRNCGGGPEGMKITRAAAALIEQQEAELAALKEAQRPAGYHFVGEGTMFHQCDCGSEDDEPVGVCLIRCGACGWYFYGDAYAVNQGGFNLQGEQVPPYCPQCGRPLGDEELPAAPEKGE